jgi:hypothetical protein
MGEEMNEYDEHQQQIKQRKFIIGWRQVDSQERIYYDALFDSWHEANHIAVHSCQPGFIPFVEFAMETQTCILCKGSGYDNEVEDTCSRCHGKGRIRKL